jgi:hypothetical protein
MGGRPRHVGTRHRDVVQCRLDEFPVTLELRGTTPNERTFAKEVSASKN